MKIAVATVSITVAIVAGAFYLLMIGIEKTATKVLSVWRNRGNG